MSAGDKIDFTVHEASNGFYVETRRVKDGVVECDAVILDSRAAVLDYMVTRIKQHFGG